MSWKELVNKALLGTDWGKLPPSLTKKLESIGISPELPAERILLEGAAIFHPLKKAALELEDFSGEIPQPETADKTSPCSAKSSHHLQLILEGPFRPALPEFVTLLKDSNKRLPPESLPVLFDASLTDRQLWRQLRPAVGPVGEWLLRQNPSWDAINPVAEPEDWEQGLLSDRRRFLRRLHESAPAEAIEKLRRTWSGEAYRTKLAFLEVLRDDPHEADIEFLEACLEDSRKEVRLAAAEILSRHAGAPMVDRLFQRATEYLSVNEHEALEVRLPSEFDKALQHDGIIEKPKEKYHTSPRGRWLMQIVARIPPSRWNELFDCDADGCLQLFTNTDLRKAFLLALTEAVNRHGDEEWMSVLLRYWHDSQDDSLWNNDAAKKMMEQLPEAHFNEYLIHHIEQEGPLISNNGLPYQLLSIGAHWWTDRLSLHLIQGFQNWMSDAPPFQQGFSHYRTLLQVAAYRSNTALLEGLRKGWPMTARSWPQWQDDVEQFINILHFRREMQRALDETRIDPD